MNNKPLAGALAIGALSLTFGGCTMFKTEPEYTLADSCVHKTVNHQANEAAGADIKRFKIKSPDVDKIKAPCADKSEFDVYNNSRTIHIDLENR